MFTQIIIINMLLFNNLIQLFNNLIQLILLFNML